MVDKNRKGTRVKLLGNIFSKCIYKIKGISMCERNIQHRLFLPCKSTFSEEKETCFAKTQSQPKLKDELP